ncbi:MAG: hypothetical protein U0797_26490 [Gemmataceae bacterium]
MARLTDDVERSILSFIRAGGFAHVAAEAAGVPREEFEGWLARPGPRYRAFALAVRQAEAQARLRVEVAVLDARPLDWLKSGPGKPRHDFPGWTAAARATAVREDASGLARREIQDLLAALLDVVGDRPDVRGLLADVASNFGA